MVLAAISSSWVPTPDDFTPVEHDDPIGVADGTHPLGDDDDRGIGRVPARAARRARVGRVVKGGEGIVEQIDARAVHDRAGDRQPLALARPRRWCRPG